MIFSTISTTYLAFMPWASRLNVIRLEAFRHDSRFANEMGRSLSAMPTDKEIGFVTSLIYTPPDLPLLFKLTFLAWVVRPLKRFFRHEAMSVLR